MVSDPDIFSAPAALINGAEPPSAVGIQDLEIVTNAAIILSKATLNGVGNYTFRATVVDNSEPGTSDQFGLQVTNPGGVIL